MKQETWISCFLIQSHFLCAFHSISFLLCASHSISILLCASHNISILLCWVGISSFKCNFDYMQLLLFCVDFRTKPQSKMLWLHCIIIKVRLLYWGKNVAVLLWLKTILFISPVNIDIRRQDSRSVQYVLIICLQSYAANDNEYKMLKEYIKSFQSGSISAHKDGSRHWIRNTGPIVETWVLILH